MNFVIDAWAGDATLLGTGAGRLWILAADGTLAEFAPNILPPGVRITDGARLRSGLLAVTTQGEGVWVLDPEGRLVQRLGVADGLPSAAAYSVREDREGGVWIGTSMGGARVELGSAYTFFNRENGRSATVWQPTASTGP